MDDQEDVPPPPRIGRVRPARLEASQDRASARRLALERTEKWRLEDKTVWPPAPKKPAEAARHKPKRKGGNGVLAVFGVVFVSVWAFLIGLAAGIGHKDFSESLASNVGNALFDVLLWVLQDAVQAEWKTPEDVKSVYASASILANNRVVFNIKGNQYRLIVAINYKFGIIYIRFIGSHQDYDKVDAATV